MRRFVRAAVFFWENRLTPRGRYLVGTTAIFALLGFDTRTRQVYILFSISAALLVLSTLFSLRPRPRASLACRLPDRATTGTTARFVAEIQTLDGAPASDL